MSQPPQRQPGQMGQPTDHRNLVELEIPAESTLGQEDARRLARESFYVELYRLGLIGSGRAAALLGMDRSTFLDLLSTHGVSWWDDTMDIAQEVRNALPDARQQSGRAGRCSFTARCAIVSRPDPLASPV